MATQNGGAAAAPATNAEIQAEAAEMTTAQKIEAATQITKAITPLVKEAGPMLGPAIQAFGSTIAATPQMFVPALTALLALPLPQPVKDSIKALIQQAKAMAPGPAPKTPPPPSSSAVQNARDAAKPFPWVPVLGGLGVAGLIAIIATRGRRRRRRR